VDGEGKQKSEGRILDTEIRIQNTEYRILNPSNFGAGSGHR
jgi:hypothetical protein